MTLSTRNSPYGAICILGPSGTAYPQASARGALQGAPPHFAVHAPQRVPHSTPHTPYAPQPAYAKGAL